MLIDDNLVSIDNVAVTAEAIEGEPVALTSLLNPGRAEPIPVCVMAVEEDMAGGTSLELAIYQSAAEDGDYVEVAGSSVTVLTADLKKGSCVGWRFLPKSVTAPWLKVVATPTGTFTAGKIFAAVMREDPLPYIEGMYINGGTVIG